MPAFLSKKITVVAILFLVAGSSFLYITKKPPVDFTTEVKPIFNKNCITCHGGVKQKGGFSLLFREEALAITKSGKPAIIPGDAGSSEMLRRLSLKDPEERMPYKHDHLSAADIEILTRWINEGAHWGEHWAYAPVKETPVPQPATFFGLFKTSSKWASNEVDNFIEAKRKAAGVSASPQANKETLLRRAALDIIGMPAPENIAQQYLIDSSDKAYQNLVDSLLASPHYGEKWAALWMDLARYADTKGYERDDTRNIWHYRDWLINAFNRDIPYDSFLTKQIAGDLLPGATDEDFIATAFQRNTMTNDEGGTDNEEFRTAAVMDRVNTTWQATMGTTFACVQCHSHPYDPFKHEDYYKFLAFYNDSRDEDTEADYPLLRHYNDSLQKELLAVTNWLQSNASPAKAKEAYVFLKTWGPAYNSLTCDSFTNSELSDTKWLALRNKALCRLKNVDLTNRTQLIFRYQGYAAGGTWQIHIDEPTGPVIANVPLKQTKNGWTINETNIIPQTGFHNLYFTYINPLLKKPEATGALFDWFYFTNELASASKPGYDSVEKKYWRLLNADVPTTPVMMDNPANLHRTSYVFERGNWLVKGAAVQPDIPKSLGKLPANAPANRLGMAQWLTSDQNPLTARTMVNRVWEQLFGTGLVETLEDMGSQGTTPTHQELLDWLSYRFMHGDQWSVKKLIKTIVLSSTYRQDSKITVEQLQKDPLDKFYARYPRVRLSAEQIRDQALCISGVISNKMFGPSVFPYQPKGIWLSPWNGAEWVQSKNEDQYRRALYTYWKRSAAYPSMLTFDGVSREVCTVRRIRTNTPLQALTALNDSAYIDLARHFAYRMQTLAGSEVAKQIKTGFKLATHHEIDAGSLQALTNLYKKGYDQFKNNADNTCEMVGGINEHTNPETAALIVVANAILNLDEVVTKN
ncbi:DUF1553 domain-containing protein [Ferruginibacter paludis]|uniref:DUF1553 domain-containing protein n=1 Tax=Ferruginibacter paludis TaxID=1310417 RepID=UPI0025B618E9|nr:DUF1553 domain-containing protein [Ferruginibacter paludis]MDN3658258.1 DUF1553 domain-containing protein [Ferruginibacter paludis]